MKTDRELLELAAKAEGRHWNTWDYERVRNLGHMVTRSMMWNPFIDDVACARLEVACELQVDIGDIGVISERLDGTACFEKYEDHSGDKNQARRRASVRAAAAIGEQMQNELSREA
ncbi:hypothetical protein ACS8E9_09590 [Pseudomonas neustonica]|uniref:hypothetical protein n=1 Tax=Pseudomonas neustonica TaxID=2487346 RepID=UPI003F47E249